ncbi:MAG: hypothetical protein Q9170_005565 [Blastenia crenularia]
MKTLDRAFAEFPCTDDHNSLLRTISMTLEYPRNTNGFLSKDSTGFSFSKTERGQWYFKNGRTVRKAGEKIQMDSEGRIVYDQATGKPKEMDDTDARYWYSSEWIVINGAVDGWRRVG